MSVWINLAKLAIGVIFVGGLGMYSIPYSAEYVMNIIDENHAKYVEKEQWKFLYKFGTKVFEYVKSMNTEDGNDGKTKKITERDLLSWLKGSSGGEDQQGEDWEKFREICKTKDPETYPPARLCTVKFKGEEGSELSEDSDGDLGYWGLKDKDSNKGYKGFDNWPTNWSNWRIWDSYWSKYEHEENPIEKFDEWYEQVELEEKNNQKSKIKSKLTVNIGK